jgi:transketolase
MTKLDSNNIHQPQTKLPFDQRVAAVREVAKQVRINVLDEGEAQGEGYVGQAMGAADIWSAVYIDQLRYNPNDPDWIDRDYFLMSVGHYALGLYAILAEAGYFPRAELASYAADDSMLPMSEMKTYTPGVEISGGSLGHGLGIAVGLAMGLRHQNRTAQRVFCMFSDGELDEGSTWEAAMEANKWQLGNLIAIADLNGLQADGRTADVLPNEPQQDRWAAFGWDVQRVDGNDVPALLRALDNAVSAASAHGKPHIILCDTKLGKAAPMLENREKLHFMKIKPDEWEPARQQVLATYAAEEN